MNAPSKLRRLDLSRYRHVIWDWNGTLLNDVDAAREVVNGMLRRRGLPTMSPGRYRAVFDFPIERYYTEIGFDFAVDPFADLALEFHEAYRRAWPRCGLYADAEETLRGINAAGVEQSLLSASEQAALTEHVSYHGVRDQFVRIVGIADGHGGGKTAEALRWIDELGRRAGEVLLVGDTVHDHEVAQAAGVDCALIAEGHQARAKLQACGAPVYDSLAELFRD